MYGPWNNVRCVQWCVSEVQGAGKVTVQLSVVGFVLVGVSVDWYTAHLGVYRL